MKDFEHKKADDLFYDICKELGREPTLQEFMDITKLQKSSYYRVRKQYRLGLEKAEERYAMSKKNK